MKSLDVRQDHLKLIQAILKQHIPHCKVIAFGSRTQHHATDTSDLDLCIMSHELLSFEDLAKLRDAFSLSILPYKVDIIEWNALTPEFQTIIRTHSVLIQSQT